jgi:RND family efflux transporter MFP subunit
MDFLTRRQQAGEGRRRRPYRAAAWASIPCLLAGAFACVPSVYADGTGTPPRSAPPLTVAAQQQTGPVRYTAYGQVEPTSIVTVRVVDAGTLSDLHVLPGSTVSANAVLAEVKGPQMRALLTQRETALQSAQARLEAATRSLAITRDQLAEQLSTKQALDAASSELAAARAAEQTAQAQLAETRGQQVITAPVAGSVIAVSAANGEQVRAGDTLVTIQPSGSLWVRAKYYGEDASALRIGMTGRFAPAGGGASVPVSVINIAQAAGADGALQVGLVAPSRADWISGQWGTVTLDGAPASYVTVPTAALILDRGEWWVLVRTPKGDEPRRVVPGHAQGWQTRIVSGLRAGEQVVAQDAFLEYHRGIADTYQPPD